MKNLDSSFWKLWGTLAQRRAREVRPVLITGGTGLLGRAFARICEHHGIPHVVTQRTYLDISCEESVRMALTELQPSAVINAAGFNRIDEASEDLERCVTDNTLGPIVLVACCLESEIPLVTFSSDMVFGGDKATPYEEEDQPSPVNLIGASKADAEARIQVINPLAMIVRTGPLFSPWDESNFISSCLRALALRQHFFAPCDLTVSPTYAPHLVEVTLGLLRAEARGIWHLANQGSVTFAEWARLAAEAAGLPTKYLVPVPAAEMDFRARRPKHVPLTSKRGLVLPTTEEAIHCYLAETSTAGWLPELMEVPREKVFLT